MGTAPEGPLTKVELLCILLPTGGALSYPAFLSDSFFLAELRFTSEKPSLQSCAYLLHETTPRLCIINTRRGSCGVRPMPNGNTSPSCWPGCTGLRASPTRVADQSRYAGTTAVSSRLRCACCLMNRLPTLRTRAQRITAIRCVWISDSCAPAVCVRQTCGMAISPAEVRRFDFERMECPACGEPKSTGGFECNGLWLLKNSPSRNSQKFHSARMRYKRRSRFWWTFSTPPRGQSFQKRGFSTTTRFIRQQSETSAVVFTKKPRQKERRRGGVKACLR
jgi:hypothetical protein